MVYSSPVCGEEYINKMRDNKFKTLLLMNSINIHIQGK